MAAPRIVTREASIEAFKKDQEHRRPGIVGVSLENNLTVVPTGISVLDRAIGIGGLPMGQMIELFGDEGVGKSSLAMIMGASFQAHDHQVLWIDMERRFWGSFAIMLGIDPGKFTLVQPVSGEEALQIAKEAINIGAFGLIVIDSVAALVSDAELNADLTESSSKAPLSQLMASGCKQLAPLASVNNVTILWVNQLRSKPMVRMGKTEESAGGRALKFWASLRIELDRTESIQLGNKTIGHKIRAKIVKNSCAPPYGICFYEFRYDSGVDYKGSVIESAIELGIIQKRSSYFDCPGSDKPFAGKTALDAFVRSNDEVYKSLSDAVRNSEAQLEHEKAMPEEAGLAVV